MNDVNEWIKERRRIHNAATEGPWHEAVFRFAEDDIRYQVGTDADEDAVVCESERSPQATEDHRAIVDAHNITVPTALSMVEAVLKLHVLNLDFDGMPYCEGCSIPYEVMTTYPCPTVRTIEGAINE